MSMRFFNRGLALIALGWPEGALASFDKALAIQPTYVDALNNRALVLVALGGPKTRWQALTGRSQPNPTMSRRLTMSESFSVP